MFKNILKAAWLTVLFACCQLAAAATSISVSATPNNPAAMSAVMLSVTITADPDPVSVTQVEYFYGSTSLGVAVNAPFSLEVAGLPAGSYAIVAKASTTDPINPHLQSAPLTLVVGTPPGAAAAYFIHTDQLDTPRVIADSAGTIVWRWDSDPFGKDAANEQPTGQAAFVFNPRFPGQQFDRESGLHYNYFRDYDPQLGRYVQSDPIGLAGGVNTFGYVEGNPISKVDATGEIAFVPIVIGIGAGLAFDYGLEKWKENHCTCKNASSPAGAVGNAAVGAANGTFGPYATKPRTGIAGGGAAGSSTSVYSQTVSEAYKRGAIGVETRSTLRGAGRVIAKGLPFASAAIAAYEIYDVFNCD